MIGDSKRIRCLCPKPYSYEDTCDGDDYDRQSSKDMFCFKLSSNYLGATLDIADF